MKTYGSTPAEPWSPETEEQATLLLQEAGAFRRFGPAGSPRREADLRRREIPSGARVEDEASAVAGPGGCHAELDALAEAARLSPLETAALALCRIEERNLREAAHALGLTVYRVRALLASAARKCGRRRHEPPVSARALFYAEIRQKRASVYRRPPRRRPAASARPAEPDCPLRPKTYEPADRTAV